jgi:hypothetical protein
MSDDRQFKIQISADASSVSAESQKAGSALSDLESKSKQFTEADVQWSSKIVAGKHDVRAALEVLGSQLGEFAGLARFAFNPWTVAMGALVVAIRSVQAANAQLKASLEALKTPIGDLAGAIADVRAESIKQDEAFHKATENLTRDTKIRIEAIHAEEEAEKKLTAAMEKNELSQAKTPEEKQQIEAKYGAKGAAADDKYKQAEINARQGELDNLQLALHEAQARTSKAAPGMSKDQVNVSLKAAPKTLSDLDKQIADISKTAEDQRPGWGDWAMAAMSPSRWQNYQDKTRTYQSSQETIGRLTTLRKQTAGRVEPLERAQAGFDEQSELSGRISELAPELVQQRKNAALSAQTDRLAAAPDIIDRGQQALSDQRTGKYSAQDAAAVAQLSKLSTDTGLGNRGLFDAINRLIDTQQGTDALTKEIMRHVQSLEGTRKTTAPGT